MCTNRIDYCEVLAKAGIIKKTEYNRLFDGKHYHTFSEIDEYRQFCLANRNYTNTFRRLLATCRFASLDDMSRTINAALDEPFSATTESGRHVWNCVFLAQYGFMEELWKEIDTWQGPYIFFCKGLTPLQRFEIYDKITSEMDRAVIYSLESFVSCLSISMVAEANWFGNKQWIKTRPMKEIREGMEILIREGGKRQIEIDWSNISNLIPIEYVIANPEYPWDWRVIGYNCVDLQAITVNAHLPWNWYLISCSLYLTIDELLACPFTRPFMHSATKTVKADYRNKARYGIWDWIRHADNRKVPTVFTWHGAAGVIQRTWRRHKERLRRRRFAAEWLGYTLLEKFPKDIQWMIYRYTRPAGAERGLPPKLR